MIRGYLKAAKKKLILHKHIENPLLYIKSRQKDKPIVELELEWSHEEGKPFAVRIALQACNRADAIETVLMCTVDMDLNPDNEATALMVKLERPEGIQRVVLPFELTPDRKVIFGEEQWEIRKTKNPKSLFENFVR